MEQNKSFTLEITLKDETRTIEFRIVRADLAVSDAVFAAQIGNGTKLHAACGDAWMKNGKWEFTTATRVLNRNARIFRFRDTVEYAKSNHRGSNID